MVVHRRHQTSVLYKELMNYYTTKFNKVKLKLEEYYSTRDFLISKIEPEQHCIRKVTFEQLKNIKKFSDCEVVMHKETVDKLVRNLARTNYLIQSCKSSLDLYTEMLSLTYEDVDVIIRSANTEFKRMMLETGYILSMGFGLGSLTLINKKSLKPKIDWKSSKELKQRIIDEGKTPFKAIKDESGKIVGNNSGVEWFVYYSNGGTPYYRWHCKSIYLRRTSIEVKHHNKEEGCIKATMQFKPFDSVNRELRKYGNENPNAKANYLMK